MRIWKWIIGCLVGIANLCVYACGHKNVWTSFINDVTQCRNDETNRVYCAGTNNAVSVLYHESAKGIKEWQINTHYLSDDILRPFCADKQKWVVIKEDNDEKFLHLDMMRVSLDFARRLPLESALIRPSSEFFLRDGGGHYKDGTPMLICRQEYKVIATKSNALRKGDVVCLGWPVDDYASTTNILSNKVKYHKHSIEDGRTLYVTWSPELLSRGESNRYFYISDKVAVPLELVWDSDINHEALVPFDEKMVIDAYMRQCDR